MRRELRDRVAVITGASSGIGRAAALALAREGVQVVLGARRADRLQEAVEAIRRGGGKGRALQTDVTQPEDVQRLMDQAVAAFGRLDILVNNAGLGYFGQLESMPMEEIRHLFEVNVMGTIYGIQAAAPIMRSQHSGQHFFGRGQTGDARQRGLLRHEIRPGGPV
jgi:NADP-dependent 3-hydroxy acid dehydrogenase YdfG